MSVTNPTMKVTKTAFIACWRGKPDHARPEPPPNNRLESDARYARAAQPERWKEDATDMTFLHTIASSTRRTVPAPAPRPAVSLAMGRSALLGVRMVVVAGALLCTCCGDGHNPQPTEATGSWICDGIVTNEELLPLAGAHASISVFRLAVSDSTGRYQLSLGPTLQDGQEISFTCEGYRDTLVRVSNAAVVGDHRLDLDVRMKLGR
jgi:hypothetical protein